MSRPPSILAPPPRASTVRYSTLPSTNLNTMSTTSNNSNATTAALRSRIQIKRQELSHLTQMRDLSRALAEQMAQLETKLATLRNGAESVACILANWDNVLRAISMASSNLTHSQSQSEADPQLPTTLVRIPIGQMVQEERNQKEGEGVNGG